MSVMMNRLGRHPLRSILVVLTLALGAGAATTMISAIHGVLLAPLPYPQPEQLVSIHESEELGDFGTVGYATFDDWRRSLRSFSSIAAASTRSATLMGTGEPMQLSGLAVSHEMFETLGVRPQLGREFTTADVVPGSPRIVVISDELWKSRFSADRNIIGKTIYFGDVDVEVVGVMPPRTRIRDVEWRGMPVDYWLPLKYTPELPQACRTCRHIHLLGRVRPGVTIDAAARELETFTATLRRAYPTEYPSRGYTVVRSLQDMIVGRPLARSLWIVFAVTGLVLIAAVANAGSIRLTEIHGRRNELQVRQALGATPGRLARLLIGESLVQSFVAALLALAIANAGVAWLSARAAAFVPRAADLRLNPLVISLCILVALTCGAAIGLIAAMRARRATLPDGGRGVVGSRSRAQQVLVGVTIALSVVLLGGSALLLRTVQNLFSTPAGLDARDVAVFRISVNASKYEEAKPLFALYDRFLKTSAALPGVGGVALTSQLPFAEDQDNASMHAEDRVGRESPSEAPDAQRFAVTPDYFATLRIPVRRGRAFADSDRTDSEPVAILNETAARLLWPNQDPIGRRTKIGGGDDNPYRRVVGIVGDVAPGALGAQPRAQAYLPLTQFFGAMEVTGIARTSGTAAPLHDVMRQLDPDIAFYRMTKLSTLVAESEARRTFILTSLSSFSIVTLILAVIGVYGIVSLLVSSRTREMGVRMALGASARGVFALVVKEGLRVVVISVFAGIAFALIAGRALTSLLYGIRSGDPATLLGIAAVVIASSFVACAIPALRAARVSPLEALREE